MLLTSLKKETVDNPPFYIKDSQEGREDYIFYYLNPLLVTFRVLDQYQIKNASPVSSQIRFLFI